MAGYSALYIVEWTGGLFFWIIKGFKGKYRDQLAKRYFNRNIWTGYLLQLLLAGCLIYIIVKNSGCL